MYLQFCTMTYHSYISLYLFFISIFYLFLEIESFTPEGRLAHYSVLVGNKLYFFGGATSAFCSNDVFYLDVSQQFNMATPPWTVSEGMPITSCWGTVSLVDTNNEQTVYLFGGLTRDTTANKFSLLSLVYKFNIKSSRWEIPIIKGKGLERRNMRAINNSGKIYIFGGQSYVPNSGATTNYFNDMIVFDTVDSSLSISYPPNAPQIYSYSATLLSNGVIAYIGGIGPVELVDISQVSLYDTNSSTWSIKSAKLIDPIESRRSHTAVLASNGKIIIYGGSKKINDQANPDVAVLNTKTEPFEWTKPLVSSNIGVVPALTAHTANLVGNYMIVTFGNITQLNARPLASKNGNVYIMDTRNYTWVNTFEPENIVNPTPPNSPVQTSNPPIQNPTTSVTPPDVNNQLTTKKIVVGVVSATFGTAIFMTLGFLGYKRYQRNKKNGIMRISGNYY